MGYRVLAVILLILSLALNIKPLDSSPIIGSAKTSAFYALYPFQFTTDLIIKVFHETSLFFVRVYKLEKNLEETNLELEKTRIKLYRIESLEYENQRLEAALGFANYSDFTLTPCNVVGRDEKNWNSTILIDAGESDGVHPGLTVISGKGLVGKVVESEKFVSKVMLITAPQSSISVVISKNSVFGIAKGGYGRNLKLEYIPENASIEPFSQVAVSGGSRTFIPGILVGRVSKVERSYDNIFQKIEVSPETDFSALEVVFVCKSY